MTSRPQTFIEYQILSADAKRGRWYQSFEDFWEKRMEPMQFIPRDSKGVLAAVREALKQQAETQYLLWRSCNPLPTADGCGGLPQAGELRKPPAPTFAEHSHG